MIQIVIYKLCIARYNLQNVNEVSDIIIMKKPLTPFPTTGYFGTQYFCNREEETQRILMNIRGRQSTILIAPRRIGKTALILHVLGKLPPGTKGIYLDILPAENMAGFLNELASAVSAAVESAESSCP